MNTYTDNFDLELDYQIKFLSEHGNDLRELVRNNAGDETLLSLTENEWQRERVADLIAATRSVMAGYAETAVKIADEAARVWFEYVRDNPATYEIAVAKRFDIETIGGARNVKTAILLALESGGFTYGDVHDALLNFQERGYDPHEAVVALAQLRPLQREVETRANRMWQERRK